MTKYNSAVHALNEIIAKQFSESPSIRPLYERFGQATLPSNKVSLSDRFVDLDVLLTTGEVLAKDEFNSLGGVETIAKSGRIKAKLFDEPINIPKLAAKEILQGGDTAEAIKFRKSLTDGQDALLRKIVTWITAGPTIATDKDFDPDWHAPLAARNTTTETIADPQDMSIAAGTDTDSSTVNYWGAGKTVEALTNTIALDRINLATKIDSFSDRSLLHNDGTDTFTLFLNPAFMDGIKVNRPFTAANIFGAETYAQQLAGMSIDMFPTQRLTWTGAVDGTTVYALVPNIKENLFIAFLPGGQPQVDPLLEETNRYTSRIWCKCVAFAKPHSFDGGTTIEKAVARRVVTPNGA